MTYYNGNRQCTSIFLLKIIYFCRQSVDRFATIGKGVNDNTHITEVCTS